APRERRIATRAFRIKASVRPPESIDADAVVTVEAQQAGLRSVIFELSRSLRVSSVEVAGKAAEFIQNESLAGSALARHGDDLVAVVFPESLPQGKPVELHFAYSGNVLSDAGGGLLYVGARGIWYPNFGLNMADFDLEFRAPATWTLVATGKLTSSQTLPNGDQVTHWVSERPIPVAGFNLGHYKVSRAEAGTASVETYAAS